MKKSGYSIDMVHGALLGKIMLFTIPLMFSGMLQLLFNAADVIVVGRYAGKEALAAVGSTSSLINLIVGLFMGLSVGGNVVVARYLGEQRERDVKETVHTSIAISLFGGILLLLVGTIGSRQFLIWMDSPSDVLPLATTYLRIYFLGIPFLMVYNFGSALLRAIGDTRRPLYYLMVSGVINVGLNLILVICFKMGVAGVAIATVVSEGISATLVVRCLMKEKSSLQLELKKIKIYKRKVGKILKIGLPAGLQGIVFSLSNVVIQSSINSFGSVVIAGNSAASNVEGFVYIAMNAIHQTAQTFTGQNAGAREHKRIVKILFICLGIVTIVGTLFGNLVYLFSEQLLGLYSDSPEVIEAGRVRLLYICTIYALCGIMEIFVGVLRGMGYATMPMIVSVMGACVFRLVWIATIFKAHHKAEVLYISYGVSWTLTIMVYVILTVILFRRQNKLWKSMENVVKV